ncbi:MAG: DUF721 domain-containing protein [Actinomycetia bacterium]|nr:DUF721 domain-containing protein [Actinomycetes bacterium]
MDRIEDTLLKMTENTGIESLKVGAFWNEIVGENLAKNSQPIGVKKGTLFVRTLSPVWSQELIYIKHKIIKLMNIKLKYMQIKNIVFTYCPRKKEN